MLTFRLGSEADLAPDAPLRPLGAKSRHSISPLGGGAGLIDCSEEGIAISGIADAPEYLGVS